VKFRVTYWPRTNELPAQWAKVLSEKDIEQMAKVAYIEAEDWDQACRLSFYRYSHTSDGTLVEYVKTCQICTRDFYAKREHGNDDTCPECAADLVLA